MLCPDTGKIMSTVIPTWTTDLTQAETSLRLSWAVTNPGADNLYVCVRTNVGNELFAQPYTYLHENNSIIVMTFRTIPIPPDMEVYAPDIPFYRMLEAGQSTDETVHVPLPIREIHPYCARTYPDKPTPLQVWKIEFSVEYFWAKERHFVRQTAHDPELVKAGGGQHYLLESVFQLARPVTVQKRNDKFYRF